MLLLKEGLEVREPPIYRSNFARQGPRCLDVFVLERAELCPLPSDAGRTWLLSVSAKTGAPERDQGSGNLTCARESSTDRSHLILRRTHSVQLCGTLFLRFEVPASDPFSSSPSSPARDPLTDPLVLPLPRFEAVCAGKRVNSAVFGESVALMDGGELCERSSRKLNEDVSDRGAVARWTRCQLEAQTIRCAVSGWKSGLDGRESSNSSSESLPA